MKVLNKIVSILFCFVLVFSFSGCDNKKTDDLVNDKNNSTTEFKSEECNVSNEDDFWWKMLNNGIEITKYIGNEKNVVIPSIINNKSVIAIDKDAFYNCYSLKSVIIPNSVTSIGDYAFENCWLLTSIAIPDSVTNIGDRALENYNGALTVYGYKNSFAEYYAKNNNIEFKAFVEI